MHRDIWEENIIYNRLWKLVLIDTSMACSKADEKNINCYKGYGNLKYLNDEMSIGRLENRFTKSILGLIKTSLKPKITIMNLNTRIISFKGWNY